MEEGVEVEVLSDASDSSSSVSPSVEDSSVVSLLSCVSEVSESEVACFIDCSVPVLFMALEAFRFNNCSLAS